MRKSWTYTAPLWGSTNMNEHVLPRSYSPKNHPDVEGFIGESESERIRVARACYRHLGDLRRVHPDREPPPAPLALPAPIPIAPVGPTPQQRREAQAAKRKAEVDAIRALYPAPIAPRPVSVRDIQDVVASYFFTTAFELCSSRRTADIVAPRQLAMLLCKRLTPRSLPDIGRRFGDRDHTTVLYAVRKFEARTRDDPQWAELVEVITETIKGLP